MPHKRFKDGQATGSESKPTILFDRTRVVVDSGEVEQYILLIRASDANAPSRTHRRSTFTRVSALNQIESGCHDGCVGKIRVLKIMREIGVVKIHVPHMNVRKGIYFRRGTRKWGVLNVVKRI